MELTQRLAAADEAKLVLVTRVQELEKSLSENDTELQRALAEVRASREELSRSRSDLERWREEMANLREKLRNADSQNLVTLQTTVTLLQRALDRESETQGKATPKNEPPPKPR